VSTLGGWDNDTFSSSFQFLNGAKNSQKDKSEARRRRAERKSEAAAAIPFPLKPLFLAAAADANDRKFGF
jgi:hypothetical protein